ncbi:coagulase domain-containing protein [Staphylococcus hyicus]|uniref:coagulase domain-containing protein n=1 Tax=Staphylococcus hyicus TaxID=1284 RepID=UPI003735F99F
MKKKLLVLSASAILASNFIFDNSASAVVDVSKNEYKSKSLSVGGYTSSKSEVKKYLDSLDDLIYYKSINMHAGYDETEYKDVLKTYRKKFMAEMEALNQFRQEQNKVDNFKFGYWNYPKQAYGLTYDRYLSVFNNLKEIREEFDREVDKLEFNNEELKRFDSYQQYKSGLEINRLENQILMIGKAYINVRPYAVQNLYNRLDMVLGTNEKEYKKMLPTNSRMFKIKLEDLESIIDDFFEDIGASRPLHIEPLSSSNENDEKAHQKLREDVVKAKNDKNYSHPRAIKKAEELAKAKKAKEEAKAKRLNGKIKVKQSSQPQKFPHKILKQTRLSKQENKAKDINVKGDSDIKKLKGMSGESNNFTVTHNSKPSGQSKGNSNFIEYSQDTAPKNNELNQQNPTTNAPVVKETITESNVVDIDQSSFYEKSGYKYGYSESDTSGYTERDKRAIRRNHVREAEELVNKYVNSHAYQDRVAAQAKVKTLSPEQQKRLNQQIDKIYNGQ